MPVVAVKPLSASPVLQEFSTTGGQAAVARVMKPWSSMTQSSLAAA